MIVLGLDTATTAVGAALGGPDGPLAELTVHQGRRHGEILAPLVDAICRLAETPLDRVGLVAVDVGPGLFTGLRVGVATARALGSALGVPVVGRTSLAVLAHAQRGSDRLVAAVVDARRGQVFWALYRTSGETATELSAPAVADPADVAAALAALGEPVRAVGDGALRHAGVLTARPGVTVGGPLDAHPGAAVLVDLVGPDPAVGVPVVPLYLRPADVRIGWPERPVVAAVPGG